MKNCSLLITLPAFLLLLSCDQQEPASPDQPATANPSGSSPAQDPAPAAQTPAKPAPPKVNVAKLNQQLQQAISFKDFPKGVAAIQAGADPHAKNRYGLPIIFTVAQFGNGEMIKALVDKGADPNSKIGTTYNTDGVGYAGTQDGTPLGYAAQKGNLDTMKALIEAGADVNGGGEKGTTALTQSVDSGKSDVVEYLIANGAKDTDGHALSTISMIINPDEERKKIIDLLKQSGQ